MSERYAEMRDKMHDAADQGRRTLHDRQDQACELAQQARNKAQSMAEDTTQSMKRLLEEQPILMAALGAALGAAVGAALPLSRQEKELLGGVGATAVGAGREALSSAAGVLREEVAQADLGGKVERTRRQGGAGRGGRRLERLSEATAAETPNKKGCPALPDIPLSADSLSEKKQSGNVHELSQ